MKYLIFKLNYFKTIKLPLEEKSGHISYRFCTLVSDI